MNRIKLLSALALLAGLFLATPALAQTGKTAVVAGPTSLMEKPQGDARVLAHAPMGTVVQVIDRFQDWYLVSAPVEGGGSMRGWVQGGALQLPDGSQLSRRGSGRFMIRGFGRAGGMLFSAHDSFDAILGRSFGSDYGGGAQVVLPNGVFVEASVDRFRHDGSLVVASGSQVFRLDTPARLTLKPVQFTAGYRRENAGRLASYVGAGVARYTLNEESPFTVGRAPLAKQSIGYHVLGGAEYKVLRFVWLGGEVQWATVPKAIGETGVSALFQEKDLGGTSIRFKFIVGY
jgi:hypothetical protein